MAKTFAHDYIINCLCNNLLWVLGIIGIISNCNELQLKESLEQLGLQVEQQEEEEQYHLKKHQEEEEQFYHSKKQNY
jgi:hypothetical protein